MSDDVVIRANRFGKSYVTLDLLRGLSALAVFLCHARGASFVEFVEKRIENSQKS